VGVLAAFAVVTIVLVVFVFRQEEVGLRVLLVGTLIAFATACFLARIIGTLWFERFASTPHFGFAAAAALLWGVALRLVAAFARWLLPSRLNAVERGPIAAIIVPVAEIISTGCRSSCAGWSGSTFALLPWIERSMAIEGGAHGSRSPGTPR